jgi:hypothetical protein
MLAVMTINDGFKLADSPNESVATANKRMKEGDSVKVHLMSQSIVSCRPSPKPRHVNIALGGAYDSRRANEGRFGPPRGERDTTIDPLQNREALTPSNRRGLDHFHHWSNSTPIGSRALTIFSSMQIGD